MSVGLNTPYFARRVANTNGVLRFIPLERLCGEIQIGKAYFGRRVASENGVLHYLFSNQQLDEEEEEDRLKMGKAYFGRRIKLNDDGSLHYLTSGQKCALCDGCGVEIPVLQAVLELTGSPYYSRTYTDAFGGYLYDECDHEWSVASTGPTDKFTTPGFGAFNGLKLEYNDGDLIVTFSGTSPNAGFGDPIQEVRFNEDTPVIASCDPFLVVFQGTLIGGTSPTPGSASTTFGPNVGRTYTLTFTAP